MRDDCVVWSGYVDPNGYGKAHNPRTKKIDTAQRVACDREALHRSNQTHKK